MATSLVSDDCRTVAEANSLFSTEKGLLVLRPGRSGCCNLHFTIPSGCYALVTRHGADEDYVSPLDGTSSAVWPPGLHFPYPPWVCVSNLVTMQSIVLDMPVKACKTKDNVTVNVDVSIVFRIMGDASRGEDPNLVRKFVYEVKPRGLEQQLRDAQEEAVRALARSMRHTQIYGIRSGVGGGSNKAAASSSSSSSKTKGKDEASPAAGGDGGGDDAGSTKEEGGAGNANDDDEDSDKYESQSDVDSVTSETNSDDVFVGSYDKSDRRTARRGTRRGQRVAAEMRDRLNRQFVPQGVQIQSVMIKSIFLPPDITDQMAEKTMIISRNAQQRMLHEDEMQNTRMNEEITTMLQSFEEGKEKEKAEGEERINEETVKLNDEKAQASKVEANIREETKVRIENLNAESSLEVQRVTDRTYEAVTEMRAQSEKESAEFLAQSRALAQSVLADADLTATKNRADASRTIATAEGKIAPWLGRKKEYDTDRKKMNVYEALAENGGLIVSMGGAGGGGGGGGGGVEGKVEVDDGDDDADLLTVADAILTGPSPLVGREGADGGGVNSRSRLMAELALVARGSSAFVPLSTTAAAPVANSGRSPDSRRLLVAP